MMPIHGISSTIVPPPPAAIDAVGQGQTPFKSILLDAISQVNQTQQDADQAVQQLVAGEKVNPAELLTSLQKADMSFRLMLEIRSELVKVFQEVNNVRI